MTLEELRRRIDALDEELVRLLSSRAELALRIGQLKLGAGADMRQPKREHAVLTHVQDVNRGPLSNEAVGRLFASLMDEFTQLQLDGRADDASSQ